MTVNEIIKTLDDALHLEDSPIGMYWGCFLTKQQVKDAIDLIHRLLAEINMLKMNCLSMAQTMPNMAKAERAEAIKEFAERLKDKFSGENCCSYLYVQISADNLVKEMVGDPQ